MFFCSNDNDSNWHATISRRIQGEPGMVGPTDGGILLHLQLFTSDPEREKLSDGLLASTRYK